MTTLLCNIKAQFQYPGRLDFLLRGKICRYLFVCKIFSTHFVWANDGANQLLPIVCLQKYFLCEPSLSLREVGCHTCPVGAEVPPSPLCSLPLSQPVPDLWGCWVLTPLRMHRRCHCTTSEMQFICQAEAEGKRCNCPVYTCTHICASVLKAQFEGMCDLCCKMYGCSQPGRLRHLCR